MTWQLQATHMQRAPGEAQLWRLPAQRILQALNLTTYQLHELSTLLGNTWAHQSSEMFSLTCCCNWAHYQYNCSLVECCNATSTQPIMDCSGVNQYYK